MPQNRNIMLNLMLLYLLPMASSALGDFDIGFFKKEKPQLMMICNPNSPEEFSDSTYLDECKPVSQQDQDPVHLVIATHGWFETHRWPQRLATAISVKTDPNRTLCGWFNWLDQARVINPRDASKYAKQIGGPILAEKILALPVEIEHIHLIGHSAGSWVISEAAKILVKHDIASVHLTFLDAYIPLNANEQELADINDPNITLWADHYYTKDLTLKVTETLLTNAHNVDISKITPGLYDHEFPRYWYPATVLGHYEPDERYEGKPLYFKYNNIKYGFARSREFSQTAWLQSLQLEKGTRPVIFESPKESFFERFKKLFHKRR